MAERAPRVIACPVSEGAARYPDRLALVSDEGHLSYGQLDRTVSRAIRALESLGVEPESRVGLSFSAHWMFTVFLWAILRLGAVAVPVSAREPSARRKALTDLADCDLLLEDAPEIGQSSAGGMTGSFDLSRPATILFTSGSSGSAKGVVHSLSNHWYSAVGSQASIRVDAETRWLVALPQYHAGGLSILFRCFLHGGTVALQGSLPLADALDHFQATHVSLVPTQLKRLLEGRGEIPTKHLRCVLVGGSAVPRSLLEDAADLGLDVRATYGSTEMASQITTTTTRDDLGTSGRLLPHRELQISDSGEILVRGETRFLGYTRGKKLEQPFSRSGWFSTGDLGRLDDQNRLIVHGRKDAVFISGGENIHPEEIESAILSTGLITRAIVVPVDDEEFGVRPVAFISPLVEIDELRDALADKIAGFKIPDRLLELPPDTGEWKANRALLARVANTG